MGGPHTQGVGCLHRLHVVATLLTLPAVLTSGYILVLWAERAVLGCKALQCCACRARVFSRPWHSWLLLLALTLGYGALVRWLVREPPPQRSPRPWGAYDALLGGVVAWFLWAWWAFASQLRCYRKAVAMQL